ncbi:alpha/beta hydrolase [Actinokineospora bangkokensis]|uniref:Serine aminopeptidase S33 domain-containing protein n=1 Tax=Actinokineospora bangkokensis TaxID=1193682 RepID=A0A1Q9LJ08_9PSEU|nr:alpha/beta hydrolase [Actinokineospora bangkokensis]OLR91993.1 hypothetical protein BJP25_24575 [Actinokineospora bangkokensis]
MREIEMVVPDDNGFPGTLVLPDGPGPHPAALLLWAGRADRDGDLRAGALGLGGAIAGALAGAGVASFRYDRRCGSDEAWRALGFYDHRATARAALGALAEHPEVGPVGVLGHSEGALHAAGLAADDPRVCAAVLLACPARTGKQVYLDSARHWTPADLPRAQRLRNRLLRRTPEDQVRRTVSRAEAGDPRVSKLLREYVRHDPRDDLARITVPVLALTGEKDITIPQADLATITSLVPAPVRAHRVPDLTHLLRRDPGTPTREDFRRQLSEPVDGEVLADVAEWVANALSPAVR